MSGVIQPPMAIAEGADTCPCRTAGLWCEDGQRGAFERGNDTCHRCGVTAIWHSSIRPRVVDAPRQGDPPDEPGDAWCARCKGPTRQGPRGCVVCAAELEPVTIGGAP